MFARERNQFMFIPNKCLRYTSWDTFLAVNAEIFLEDNSSSNSGD
jgi:hypothetical protein